MLGLSDGVRKTPEWAEPLTQIPAATIAGVAREYARAKPAALLAGLGYNRRAYGEQPVRGSVTLAAMTGNIGIGGGSPGGVSYSVGRPLPLGGLPRLPNPVPEMIPIYKWTEAVERGTEMSAADGVIRLPEGQRTLRANIKFIFNTAGNALINQHGDVNRTDRILRDPKLLDFIVVTDQFMTASARYADVLLPAITWFEHNDICTIWDQGASVIFMNQAIAPLHECKSDYDIFTLIADKLGLAQAFTGGRTELEWLEETIRPAQAADPTFPSFEEFRRRGVHVFKYDKPHVPFADFRESPEKNPLETPSGRIEIYSSRLADMHIEHLPPIPKFIPEWEGGPWDPLHRKYPLQAMGTHYHRRVHSTHDNVDWLEEAMPQRVYMNVKDAASRGIRNGDEVRVFNDRGELRGRARADDADDPRAGGHPPGRLVDARRQGCRPPRLRQRADIPARDPGRTWKRPAHDAGRGATSVGESAGTLRCNWDSSSIRRPAAGARRARWRARTSTTSKRDACGGGSLPSRAASGFRRAPPGRPRRLATACRCRACTARIRRASAGARPARCTSSTTAPWRLQAARCLGCRYCEWLCPYGAPRYDANAGRMSKCDLCADERQAGRPPVCVSSCPMRALEFGDLRELEARHGTAGRGIYPLPDPAITRPSVVLKVHRHAATDAARHDWGTGKNYEPPRMGARGLHAADADIGGHRARARSAAARAGPSPRTAAVRRGR